MTLASPKGPPSMPAFPRSVSTIAVCVGGLALLLALASSFLVSHQISATFHVYFYGTDRSTNLVPPLPSPNESSVEQRQDRDGDVIHNRSPAGSDGELSIHSSGVNNGVNPVKRSEPNVQVSAIDTRKDAEEDKVKDNSLASNATKDIAPSGSCDVNEGLDEKPMRSEPNVQVSANDTRKDEEYKVKDNLVASNATKDVAPSGSGNVNEGLDETGAAAITLQDPSKSEARQTIPAVVNNVTKTASDNSGCDLYHGIWFYDQLGPLYANNTCPVLFQMQNCQGNGRPDREYENWRWKPFDCDLPRFDAKKFLELMRGKTLAFIGDSVARNQMESLLCILWQVEVPKNIGNKRMHRFYFTSTSTVIVRIWSSWLVHKTSEPFDFAPQGVDKLHLDVPDESFMDYIQKFDVTVLSSGHWFNKQSVYILNNEIVGGQLWWPEKSRPMKINNVEAYGICMETTLTSLVTHPNYTGLTILRTYSPDHYEGGAWNTGGSCTGKEKPLAPGELVENVYTNTMHEKQVTAFRRAIGKATNKSKLKLMDITEAFSYRHDGHPGPYRSPDPNKITKRGPDGRPPPQDCLHWCMPGPVDTWNEFLLEVMSKEFENIQGSSL